MLFRGQKTGELVTLQEQDSSLIPPVKTYVVTFMIAVLMFDSCELNRALGRVFAVMMSHIPSRSETS